MQGKIKLFPTQRDKFVVGAFAKFGGKTGKIIKTTKTTITITFDDNTKKQVNKNLATLLKYYVVSKKKIIGELAYMYYDNVKEGNEVEVQIRTIPNKPAIGDEVKIVKFSLGMGILKPVKGIIVGINGVKADIKTYTGEHFNIKRHKYKIISTSDIKTICDIV